MLVDHLDTSSVNQIEFQWTSTDVDSCSATLDGQATPCQSVVFAVGSTKGSANVQVPSSSITAGR